MINYILLILSVICAGMKSVFSKTANNYMSEKNNIYTFNFYLFFIGWILILTVGYSSIFPLSAYTLIMAVVYALFTLSSQILLIKATDSGDVALSSLFYSCGFLVPVVAGTIIYDESVNLKQLIGIVLLLVSFIISVKADKKINFKWLFFAVGAMLSAGIVGLLQKIFRMSPYKAQMNGFLVIAFFIIIISMFILMPKGKGTKPSKGFINSAVIVGISMGFANIINLFLSGVMPSVIVFSVLNGGAIISSAVGANVFLKEKITVKKKIGILLGIISILLIAY